MKDLLGMIPGVSGKVKEEDIDESIMDKNVAIIRSMTMKERKNPKILNASRRKRIAAGSGTTVQDVNQLMKQFEQTAQVMKQFKGGKFGNMKLPNGFPGGKIGGLGGFGGFGRRFK